MAKDPAFLFYPNDWLGGTMGMTFEEKGAYMELLMLQFNRGHMTSHMIGQIVGQMWVKIQCKFKQDGEGLWYNERLEVEKEKRSKFSESRRNNIKGSNQHTKKTGHTLGHMTSHMENVNVNENRVEVKNEKKPKLKKSVPVLFRESPEFDKQTLSTGLWGTQYAEANVDWYHETLLQWSNSKGEKRIDWLATAKGFMSRDMKDGKFIDKNYKPPVNGKRNATGNNGITTESLNAAHAKYFGE